jgi:peptidoglycan/xylan/chitin deacetylase (PgdA/CDA1 family)
MDQHRQADGPHPLTLSMQIRDWLGTKIPRHLLALSSEIQCRLPGRPPAVSLSFDDGPHPLGTPLLLDVLARFDVSATFFLVGEAARRHPDLVRRIVDAGHAVGNHSWSHLNAWRLSARDVVREFSDCQALLEDQTGRPVRIVRPPYGALTFALLRWSRTNGKALVLWDVIPPDYSLDRDPARVERIYRRHLRSGSIVCLHDNDVSVSVTPRLLETLIPASQQQGLSFVKL